MPLFASKKQMLYPVYIAGAVLMYKNTCNDWVSLAVNQIIKKQIRWPDFLIYKFNNMATTLIKRRQWHTNLRPAKFSTIMQSDLEGSKVGLS